MNPERGIKAFPHNFVECRTDINIVRPSENLDRPSKMITAVMFQWPTFGKQGARWAPISQFRSITAIQQQTSKIKIAFALTWCE